MDSIIRRLMEFRFIRDSKDKTGKTIRGETTLRKVLCLLAEEMNMQDYDSHVEYVLHHEKW